MKKRTKNLIVVAICIAALGGTAIALSLTGGGGSSSSSSSSAADIELISKKSEDIASMEVTNKKGKYTLIPLKKTSISASSSAAGSASSGTAETTYTVKELAGCPVNTSETGSVVKNGFSLAASRNLGTVSDLDDFGLKNPQATVKVTFQDGSSFNYKIGKTSATDSSAYYMCGLDSSNVYMVSIDAGLLEGAEYFASKEVLTISSSDGNNSFTSIKLSGTNYPQAVSIAKQGDDLKITAPQEYGIDSEKLSSLESELTSLTATSVEAINPDSAALEKYGLDKPCATAEFTVNKGGYKLSAGEKDGKYYVMLGKVNIVYGVSADTISAWAQSGLFGLRDKTVFAPDVSSVKSFTVTVGSTANELNVTRAKDTKNSTSSETAYTYKLTGNSGKSLDYDTNYKTFYEKATSVSILEETNKKPDGSPAITLQYKYFDKADTDTVEFYVSSDRRYTAVVNGKAFGSATKDDVDKITESVKLLENGETVS